MSAKDPYIFHKTALKPLLPNRTLKSSDLAPEINTLGEQAFLNFLREQGLSSLWHKLLVDEGADSLLSPGTNQILHQDRLAATGNYLIQKNALKEIRHLLDSAAFPHVVFKGAHLRELLYPEPSTRTAVDIDVLVGNEHKLEATKVFVDNGYRVYVDASNISHEVSLAKNGITIDLHWDLMRPGRLRAPLAKSILANRIQQNSSWVPANEYALLIALVHPVITKYATAPYSSINRVLDICLMINQESIDWDKFCVVLESAGLKTAAWTMLIWVSLLTEKQLPGDAMAKLKPGPFRSRFLKHWIARNYSTRLIKFPFLIQIGFTLIVHDTFKDTLRAISSIIRAKNQSKKSVEEFNAIPQ